MRTSAEALEQRFRSKPAARIIIEAGTHSPWVSRLLDCQGHEVIVANARKVRLIYESDRKNDRLDARMLARLGRVDVNLLAPIRHRRARDASRSSRHTKPRLSSGGARAADQHTSAEWLKLRVGGCRRARPQPFRERCRL